MSTSTLRYSTGVQSDNALRIARIAAAGRVAQERAALRKRQEEHDNLCGCRWEDPNGFCADYPRK